MEAGDKLFKVIFFFSRELAGCEGLFIVDNVIAEERLDKRRQLLLDLSISGRHGCNLCGC